MAIPSDKADSQSDVWSDWLLHRRHADDPNYERVVRATIERFADRVLDGAQLTGGMTLLDVGTGDGLVALRAIQRVGPTLSVLLADISGPLLQHVESIAAQRNVQQQCRFIKCGAEKLEGIDDASVDVVTTRAVLAYVADKGAAFREIHRVLRPGGRLSIAEPIFQDDAFEASALRRLLSEDAHATDRILPLLHCWKAAHFPDTEQKIAQSPIANFSERDLIRLAQARGFGEIHMELHIDVFPSLIASWDVFLNSSPHPLAPSVGIILAEQFTAEQRELFEQVMRPTIESRRSIATERIAYLVAKKPAVESVP